jgi:uncharacterized protein (TIGR00297 family)
MVAPPRDLRALSFRMRTWLSPAGAGWALAVGTAVAIGTGWRGFVLLLVFFVTGSLLTPGGGRRRPVQVLANGGVAALGALLAPWHPWAAAAVAGALAAATADTWSTEIGRRSRAAPRLITTFAAVPAGTSGGVTVLGTLGGLAGAAAIALAARVTGFATGPVIPAIALAGVAGMLADSVLGATLQVRWRCAGCGTVTEWLAHACAAPALAPYAGVRWMTNDAVNAAATLVGALGAALPWLLARG